MKVEGDIISKEILIRVQIPVKVEHFTLMCLKTA